MMAKIQAQKAARKKQAANEAPVKPMTMAEKVTYILTQIPSPNPLRSEPLTTQPLTLHSITPLTLIIKFYNLIKFTQFILLPTLVKFYIHRLGR